MYLLSNLKLRLLLHSDAENSRPVSIVVNFILSEYDRSVRLERVGELLSSDKSYQVKKNYLVSMTGLCGWNE